MNLKTLLKRIDPIFALGTTMLVAVGMEYFFFPGTFQRLIAQNGIRITIPEFQIHNRYEIKEIPDGDSIVIRYYGRYESIQLKNVVTPVRGQPGYTEGQTSLRNLIGDNRVSLEFEGEDEERDFFGRFVPQVFVGSTHLNLEMIRLGLSAYEDASEESRYHAAFLAAEAEAKENQRGIWAIKEDPTTSDISP